MSDIQDIELDTGDGAPEAEPQAPQEQPKQLSEADIAEKVAQILGTQARQDAARLMHMQQPVQKSAMEQKMESMLKDGYSAEALKVVAEMVRAGLADGAAMSDYNWQQSQRVAYVNDIEAMKEDALDKVASDYAVVRYAASDLKMQFDAAAEKDAEFMRAVQSGRRPSKTAVNRIMASVIDPFLEATGAVKTAQPVSVSTKKPVKPASGSEAGKGSLDHEQRKLFNALKGTLGEKVALEHAKSLYDDFDEE